MRWVLLVAVGLLLAGGGVFLALRTDRQTPPIVTAPTTTPSTAPTTLASPTSAPAARPKDFLDVVRLRNPDFPTTQPLAIPVAMSEGARLVMVDPMYLDSVGELWITRPDAESTTTVFKNINNQSTHVLRENVVFVHRWQDDKGVWQPQLICRKDNGGYEIVTRSARQDIESDHKFDWTRAFSWNDVIVVPTDRGISIIRPDRRPMELYHEFVPAEQFEAGKYSPVQSLLDWQGLVAWMPWEPGKLGSKGAARFLKDHWITLDASANWPEKLLHLVPLLDGGIIQLIVREDNAVDVGMAILDQANVDEKKIAELIAQLSDQDSSKRDSAFSELTRYGMGIWPILEKAVPDQPPEAQVRIQILLSTKLQPTLGGMILQHGPVKVISRADFGGALIYSDAGVSIPRPNNEEPRLVAPAWISFQPGRPIELAPDGLTADLQIPGRSLRIVRGEFIMNSDLEGPRWWLANHYSPPLLKDNELEFKQLTGQDGRGRWLFRRNLTDLSPTLVIDPTLPTITPRFPVWNYKVEGGQSGWTLENWPAIKSGGAWALAETDWRPLDEPREKMMTEWSGMLARGPTSVPGLGVPLLVDSDGTQYFDGMQTIHMVAPGGKDVVWNLPPEATGGNMHPVLIRAGENRLFLFNSPGRVLRIKPTPGAAEPFKLEATFTHRIPNVEKPDRIWRDPAGRIIIAYEGNMLAICFPNGRIPPEIAKKMSAGELEDADK